MGDNQMGERRRLHRPRTLKTGKILLSEKAPKLECTIRNLSDGGACLQISTTVGIPAYFDLLLLGNERRACHVLWRTSTQLGIAFVPQG
jgi:hypothetical protein